MTIADAAAVAEAAPVLPQWAAILLAVLGAFGTIGGLSGGTALLLLRKSGRKIDADAAGAITAAATSLVKPLGDRVQTLEGEVGSLRDAMIHRDQLAAEHSGWDYIAEEKMTEAGIKYPARPPLIPGRVVAPRLPVEAATVELDVHAEVAVDAAP